MPHAILDVRNLTTEFSTSGGPLVAVDGVDLALAAGRTLGIVGESGCGKTITALSVMRLVPAPTGRIVCGEVRLRGVDLLRLSESEMRRVRGHRISMVFQEPMTSLNPVFSVGEQIAEAVRLHRGASRRAARDRAVEMLRQVGMPAPEERVDAFPHQLSGGMRQRVMVAMALACDPDVLIADEPTTALDVTVQAQILDLVRRLQTERHMAVLLITHDLGVVAETCDEVAVMYAGKIVEKASAADFFARPRHPYSLGLLRSIPTMDAPRAVGRQRLPAIPGTVPDSRRLAVGCRFRERCERAVAQCEGSHPLLVGGAKGSDVACFNPCDQA